jgi:hypothetical protein
MKPQDDDPAWMRSSRQHPPTPELEPQCAGARNLYATATSEQYQNIHIPGQRTSAIDGDPSSYQVTTTDLVGLDGLLYVAARALLFNLLTDETDTERQHLHTHGLQLSHGSGNYLPLVVMMLNSRSYCHVL